MEEAVQSSVPYKQLEAGSKTNALKVGLFVNGDFLKILSSRRK